MCNLMPPMVGFLTPVAFPSDMVGTLQSNFFLNKINLIIIKILFSWINLLSWFVSFCGNVIDCRSHSYG